MKCANRKRILRVALFGTLLLGLVLLASCGGGGTLPSPGGSTGGGSNGGNGSRTGVGGNSGGGSTAVLVNLGEFASLPDNVVSFELTVDSVTLRSSNGDVSLLSNPRRFELSALKTQPVLLTSAVQGNYSGVILQLSNPHISYIDSSGELHENVSASLTSSTVTNKSEFSLGGPSKSIDLNLLLRVSFRDGSSLAITPELNFSTGGQPTKNLVARILDVGSSSNFDVDVDGLPPGVDPSWYEGVFSFATGSSTKFQGLDDLGNLTSGMTVEVDAELRSDGTLGATKVQLENDDPDKVVVEGLAVSTSLAQMQMLVREGHGPYTISRPEVGTVLTVDANAATQFHLEPDGIDLDNLDFAPTFDALTIAPGQNVRAAVSGGSATNITTDWLKLKAQSIDGTAGTVTSGFVPGQFTFPLNLSAESALAKLTGRTSVLVTVQPSSLTFLSLGFENCVACIAGGSVRVRGLLFYAGGHYHLVADWLAVI